MTEPREVVAKRQKRLRSRRAKAGMVRKDVWTFPHLWDRVKAAVSKINKGE